MLFFPRRTRAILGCLIAIATLIAGSPHIHCRCPDGRVKFFCLSFARQNSCCCAGRCCSAPRQGEGCAQLAPHSSCCAPRHEPSRSETPAADPAPRVEAASCLKSLVQPDDLTAV